MSRAYTFDGLIQFDKSFQGPFAGSVLFHIGVVIFLSLGLPFMKTEPLEMFTPISVELVEIDEITQTNKPAPPKPDNPEPEKLEPPKHNPSPKMDAEAPPDLTKPEAASNRRMIVSSTSGK